MKIEIKKPMQSDFQLYTMDVTQYGVQCLNITHNNNNNNNNKTKNSEQRKYETERLVRVF